MVVLLVLVVVLQLLAIPCVVVVVAHVVDELVKETKGILGATLGFRVELDALEWFRLVADTLVRAIIQVGKVHLPVVAGVVGVGGAGGGVGGGVGIEPTGGGGRGHRERILNERVAMVLGRDEAGTRSMVEHGLVVRSIAEAEFVRGQADRCPQQQVPHTDAEHGSRSLGHQESPDHRYGAVAVLRIAGSIRQKHTIVFGVRWHVMVVRYHVDLQSTLRQASNDVLLHPAVHQRHPKPSTPIVHGHRASRHLGHQIPLGWIAVVVQCIVAIHVHVHARPRHHQLAQRGPVVAEELR